MPTSTQIVVTGTVGGRCSSDGGVLGELHAGTPAGGDSGRYCWCQITGGNKTNCTGASKWVFAYDVDSSSYCASFCEGICKDSKGNDGSNDFDIIWKPYARW